MPDLATDVGTAPSSDSFAADLNSTFADDAALETAPDAPEVAEPITSAPDLTAPPEPVAEPPVKAKPDEKAEELDLDDEIGEPRVVDFKGAKEYHFPETKAKIMLANNQFARDLREKIPGITIEQAQQHYKSDTDFRMLKNDFLHGDVARLAGEFSRLSQTANPEAFPRFIDTAARLLASTNPQAFNAVAAPIIQHHMNGYLDNLQSTRIQAFEQAKSTGNQANINAAAHALHSAQMQAYEATGKYKTVESFQTDLNSRPELSQREAELAARIQQYDEQARQQQQQQYQQRTTSLDAERDTRVKQLIDKTLERVKDNFEGRPTLQAAWKTQILTLVKDKVEQDADFRNRYNIDREAAARSGSERDREQAIGPWVNRAEGIVKAELRKLISESTQAVMAGSKGAHEAWQKTQSRKEPGGAVTPVPKSIIPSPSQAGNRVDFMKELDEAFASL